MLTFFSRLVMVFRRPEVPSNTREIYSPLMTKSESVDRCVTAWGVGDCCMTTAWVSASHSTKREQTAKGWLLEGHTTSS